AECPARGEADDFRHVGARAGAVGADDAQATPDQPRDLHGRRSSAWRDAYRHHASAIADDFHCQAECFGTAQSFEGDVNPCTISQPADEISGVGGRRIDDVGRAYAASDLELVVADVNGNDLRGPERTGDLNDVQPDAPRGDDGDAFAAAEIGAMTDGA